MYPLLLSTIGDTPQDNPQDERGRPEEIDSPHPIDGGSRTHFTAETSIRPKLHAFGLRALWKCPAALVRVNSRFIGAVSQPDFRRPAEDPGRDSNVCAACLTTTLAGPHERLPTSPLKRNSAVTGRICSAAFWRLVQLWHLCITFSFSNRVLANTSPEKQTA